MENLFRLIGNVFYKSIATYSHSKKFYLYNINSLYYIIFSINFFFNLIIRIC